MHDLTLFKEAFSLLLSVQALLRHSVSKLKGTNTIYVLPLCGEYICIKTLDSQKIKLFTRFVTFVGHTIIFTFTFPVDTLSVHTFTAAFLPSAPAAWATASGAASGRTPGGGPSPVRLLANSLKRAAAASRG